MIAKATVRYVRISSRKVRQVIDLIRGKATRQAIVTLAHTSKRASLVIEKLLRSALANAKQKGFEEENLYITRIFADEGPTWKRMRAMSQGRGGRIRKRTCHITVELDRKVAPAPVKPQPQAPKPAAPAKKTAHRGPAEHPPKPAAKASRKTVAKHK